MAKLRTVAIDAPQITILRVGVKWDPLARDDVNELHQLDSASQARAKLAAANSSIRINGFIAKLIRSTYFLGDFAVSFEKARMHSLATAKAMKIFLEQHHMDSFDLDLVCFNYDRQGNFIEYISPLSAGLDKVSLVAPAIIHSGDDTTGTGDSYDEMLQVELKAIDPEQHQIYFVTVCIDHGFDEVVGGSWSVANTRTNQILLASPMQTTETHKVHVMARLVRTANDGWSLQHIGEYCHLDENEDIPLHERIDHILRTRYMRAAKNTGAISA